MTFVSTLIPCLLLTLWPFFESVHISTETDLNAFHNQFCLDHPLRFVNPVLFRDTDNAVVLFHAGFLVRFQPCIDRRTRLLMIYKKRRFADLLPFNLTHLHLVSGFTLDNHLVLNMHNRHESNQSTQLMLNANRDLTILNKTLCSDGPDSYLTRVEQLLCEPVLQQLLISPHNIFLKRPDNWAYELTFKYKTYFKFARIQMLEPNGYSLMVTSKRIDKQLYSEYGSLTIGLDLMFLPAPFEDWQGAQLFNLHTHLLHIDLNFTRLSPIKAQLGRAIVIPNQVLMGCPTPLCFAPMIDAALYTGEPLPNISENSIELQARRLYIFTGHHVYELDPITRLVPSVRKATPIYKLFWPDSEPTISILDLMFLNAVHFERKYGFLLFFKESKVFKLNLMDGHSQSYEMSNLFGNIGSTRFDYVFEYKHIFHLVYDMTATQFVYLPAKELYMQVVQPLMIRDQLPPNTDLHLKINQTRYLFDMDWVYQYNEEFERTNESNGPIHSHFFGGCNELRSKHPWPDESRSKFIELPLHFNQKRVQNEPASSGNQSIDFITWIFFLLLFAIACVSVFTLFLLMRPNDDFNTGRFETRPGAATEETKVARLGSQEFAVSHASSMSSRVGSMDAPPSWLRHNQHTRTVNLSPESSEERLALLTVHSKQTLVADLNSMSAEQSGSRQESESPIRLKRISKRDNLLRSN